jgi:tRNA1(Val) A37 N6-methylase TrmN6
MSGALTCDAVLGGRLRLWQPARGYRAATDPVLLAAAVPAVPGERVLDLGAGVGTAGLCLAVRVPGIELHALELQPDYADLAERNAAGNGIGLTLHRGDVAAPPATLRALGFDHVLANPPWHPAEAATAAGEAGRDAANREGAAGLASWIGAALRRLRPGGRLTLILRAERLPEALAALAGPAGDIAVLPLAPRQGRPAGRIILAARKGTRGPFRLLPPLVVHAAPAHPGDREDYTPELQMILRDAAPLLL